ncbi:MAG: ATP-binding protein [Thermoanaerobaculia bacterium]|nr:ATP-binding protein [Thermoanaerobaculia bacterium]
MEDLNRKLTWLMATRLMVILSVVFGILLYNPGEVGIPSWFPGFLTWLIPQSLVDPVDLRPQPSETTLMVQFLIGATCLLTLVYASLLRVLADRSRTHVAVQLAGDLLMITLVVYKFGSSTAILSILYFVVVAVAAFMLRGRAPWITAGWAYILYALVLVAHQSGDFRSFWRDDGIFSSAPAIDRSEGIASESTFFEVLSRWLQPPPLETVSSVPLYYNLLVHLFGFVTVAFYSGYLASNPELERELQEQTESLASLRTFHRDVVQSISSGLVVTDLEGTTLSVNRSGERILGLTEGESAGGHVSETGLFSRPGWDRLAERSSAGLLRAETTVDRAGDVLHIGFTLSPLREGDGTHRGYILIFQDLTDWRELEERVRLQDRMAALGQMAAGLAHEVGNPLAAISGSTQMLARRLNTSPAEAKLLEITIKESQRLDRTVKSFLQFAKPRDRHPETFDIAALLVEDTALLRNSSDIRDDHRIELDLEPDSAEVVADIDQIGQLYWNLARNAIQAMPEGGTLTVRGRLQETKYHLEVVDTGRGMSEEEKAKLFQPFKSFFDSGLGLGMAICYRIVQEHGGQIRVESEPGQGTTIHVILPRDGIEEGPESAAGTESFGSDSTSDSGSAEQPDPFDDEPTDTTTVTFLGRAGSGGRRGHRTDDPTTEEFTR